MIKFLKSEFKLNVGIITTLLLILQSCGIRFFNGQGYALGVIILALSYQGFRYLKYYRHFHLVLGLIFFLIINSILNSQFVFSSLIYQILLIFEAVVFLLAYKSINQLRDDLYSALGLIFLHSLVGFLLFIIIPDSFGSIDLTGMPYRTFLSLFYVASNDGIRNVGLMWEPGLLQLMLNIYLFLSIKKTRSWKYLLFISLTILSTYSTIGFVILSLNFIYFVYLNVKSNKNFYPSIILSLLALFSATLIRNNIMDKVGGENTSGLIRYRDFLIGLELIKEKPIIGHGNFGPDYLLTKPKVTQIELGLFTREYLSIFDNMSGGYTNGLLGLICWYGLPIAVLAYYFVFKNKIIEGRIQGRIVFFFILMLTFISEPITYTAFFLIFPFSYFIFTNRLNLNAL